MGCAVLSMLIAGCGWVSFDHDRGSSGGDAGPEDGPDGGDEERCVCEADQVCSHGSCVDPRLDEDEDGSPAASDCDDRDPSVRPGSTRACSTSCGQGLETCLEGAWSACSAPVDCGCSPGDVRTEPCGRCGTAVRACRADGTWNALEECLGQGACEAGTTEVGACDAAGDPCRQHARRCAADCSWEDWGVCNGADDCSPGDVDAESCGSCGERVRTCSAACLWNAFSACDEVRDADGDQHDAISCGGDDCDDGDPTVHPGAAEDDAWTIEPLDEAGAVGDVGNLVLDADGFGRLAFRRGTSVVVLVETVDGWTEQTWRPGFDPTELLDPPQIALAANGALHVAYVEQYRDILNFSASSAVHITNAGGGFTDDWWTSGARDLHAWQPLVVVDADNHPHVLVAHGPEDGTELLQATDAAGAWAVESLASGHIVPWGWTIGADGVAHCLIRHTQTFRYGTSGGVWSWSNIVDGDSGALAFDDDHPWALIAGATGVSLYDGSADWAATPVADAGDIAPGALAFDASGHAHLVLTAAGQVLYGTDAGGEIHTQILAAGHSTTLAIDGGGRVRVAYADDDGVQTASRALPDGIDRDCDGAD